MLRFILQSKKDILSNILLILIISTFSYTYSQSVNIKDTLFIRDTVLLCEDGNIFQSGRVPYSTNSNYKYFLSIYQDLIVVIREENCYAFISFYTQKHIKCFDQEISSWDALPITLELPIIDYKSNIFIHDTILKDTKEIFVVYKSN